MEEALAAQLDAQGLSDHAQRLSELGVRCVDDIRYLRDGDLLATGLTLVQTRRLQALAAGPTSPVGAGALVVPGGPRAARGPARGEAAAMEGCRKLSSASLVSSAEDADPEADGGEVVRTLSSSSGSTWARVSRDGTFFEKASSEDYPVDHDGEVQMHSRRLNRPNKRISTFWRSQLRGRPLRLVLVRHGESEANVNRAITSTVPDHLLHLTERGRQEALDAGQRLKSLIGDESVKFTVSPYVRTRETLNGILRAWDGTGMKANVREDVRIREQEYGNFDPVDIGSRHQEKRKFGAFYYRFPEGESPADCYDRASLFLESMYRSWTDNHTENQVIVCHGLMILVLLMRFLRLPIEEFDNLDSLKNCEFVVLERPVEDPKYHIAFTWAPGVPKDYRGLRRAANATRPPLEIWDGNPEAPLLVNAPVIT